MIMMNDEVNDDDHYVSGVDDNDDDIDQSILLIRSRIDVLICFVTSQHVLNYCTYYSVSLTCTVHCTYCIYCTLYILYMFPCFPVSHVCQMLKLHLQHLFTHVHTSLAFTCAHSHSLT